MFCRFVHCVSLALKSPYEERGQLSMYCIVLYCIVLYCIVLYYMMQRSREAWLFVTKCAKLKCDESVYIAAITTFCLCKINLRIP